MQAKCEVLRCHLHTSGTPARAAPPPHRAPHTAHPRCLLLTSAQQQPTGVRGHPLPHNTPTMGNCFGSRAAAERKERSWAATGIVSLRDAGLKALPGAALAISPDVRILDAANNRLTQLPDAQLGWPQLQRLVLTDNALSALPPSIGSSMQLLRHLALDGNRLTCLPAEIGELSKLEVLLLQGNMLLSLPPSIGRLACLKTLNASRNQLSQLPEELGSCSSLLEVDASNNQLSSLPGSLASLTKLKVLQLDANRIEQLPSALLAGCVSLHSLSLHENPITPSTLCATPGWEGFDARRRSKYDRLLAGNALLGSAAFDEGVTRLLKE